MNLASIDKDLHSHLGFEGRQQSKKTKRQTETERATWQEGDPEGCFGMNRMKVTRNLGALFLKNSNFGQTYNH